ncbi:hypothetical protein LCR_06540 [Aeromonas enteropelogenes]|uniref:Uncharacterized protein n=1 Tax=Aeromonas enteropelogenes TaxID=29489 RepID=A0A175VLH6_AEREN|nr:hypothetical protein LCR_06540 [Aeromonas enteropelogenes]
MYYVLQYYWPFILDMRKFVWLDLIILGGLLLRMTYCQERLFRMFTKILRWMIKYHSMHIKN